MRFRDRREAGRALADRLTAQQQDGNLPDPVVLALPRGGVPVGDEIARALGAPLDVLVSRKIGAPYQPELGVGAVAGNEPPLYDPAILAHLRISEEELAPVAEREREEVRRREELYRGGRPAVPLAGRSAVLVDDGLATGATARAALHSVRRAEPTRTVLAVPVAAPEAADYFTGQVDDFVCLQQPSGFGAVGFWYENFSQLTDDEVLDVLRVPH